MSVLLPYFVQERLVLRERIRVLHRELPHVRHAPVCAFRARANLGHGLPVGLGVATQHEVLACVERRDRVPIRTHSDAGNLPLWGPFSSDGVKDDGSRGRYLKPNRSARTPCELGAAALRPSRLTEPELLNDLGPQEAR